MEKKKKIDDKLNIFLKILFIGSCLIFAVPSICYYLEIGTILEFDRYYQFLLNSTDIKIQTMWYLVILSIITILLRSSFFSKISCAILFKERLIVSWSNNTFSIKLKDPFLFDIDCL